MAMRSVLCGILSLVVVFAVVAFNGIDAGVDCYVCAADQPRCMGPADNMKKPCNESFCWKSVTTVGSGQAASRGCGKYRGTANVQIGDNECKDTDIKGAKVTVCNCNTNACNGDKLLEDLMGSR